MERPDKTRCQPYMKIRKLLTALGSAVGFEFEYNEVLAMYKLIEQQDDYITHLEKGGAVGEPSDAEAELKKRVAKSRSKATRSTRSKEPASEGGDEE